MNINRTLDQPHEDSLQNLDPYNIDTKSEASIEPSILHSGPPTLPAKSAIHVPTHPITSRAQIVHTPHASLLQSRST